MWATKPIILDLVDLAPRLRRRELLGMLVVERIEARLAPDVVDRLEAAGRHQPGARVRGNAIAWPLLERGPEGVVQRFFGEVEATEQSHQRREHAARLGTIDPVHLRADVVGEACVAHGHARCPKRSAANGAMSM